MFKVFNTILNEPLFDNYPCMDKFYEFYFCTLNIIKKDLHFAKNEKLIPLAGKTLFHGFASLVMIL